MTDLIYKSVIDGRMTTDVQYITEIVCSRIAFKEKRTISAKFWNDETWKRTYRNQLLAARSLLKIYSAEAIITALRLNKYCYSLRAKFLDEKIKIEQRKLDSKIEKIQQQTIESTIEKVDETLPKFNSRPVRESIVDKLKGL